MLPEVLWQIALGVLGIGDKVSNSTCRTFSDAALMDISPKSLIKMHHT